MATVTLPKKRGPRRIGRTKGGLNSKLHAVCDRHARPLALLLSQGQMSDHKGAGLLIDALAPARELIADGGCDSDGFRAALEGLGITPCIPSRKHCKQPHPHDTAPLPPAAHDQEPVRQAERLTTHRNGGARIGYGLLKAAACLAASKDLSALRPTLLEHLEQAGQLRLVPGFAGQHKHRSQRKGGSLRRG